MMIYPFSTVCPRLFHVSIATPKKKQEESSKEEDAHQVPWLGVHMQRLFILVVQSLINAVDSLSKFHEFCNRDDPLSSTLRS